MISIPFSGSKRLSYKNVRPIVEQGGYDTVYEPFGGSCVLSANLYNDGVVSRAVVNDYDHFFDDYGEYLDLKDLVVRKCEEQGLRKVHSDKEGSYILDDENRKVKLKALTLSKEKRGVLQKIIKENVPEKYWRYFALGTNFAWSVVITHKKISLSDFTLFCRQLDTAKQREFFKVIQSIQRDSLDWSEFLDKHQDNIKDSNSILILDPPYVDTEQSQYAMDFTKSDTQRLIDRVVELGCDFIFFNHNEENVRRWLNGLEYQLTTTGGVNTRYKDCRRDVMAYVKK